MRAFTNVILRSPNEFGRRRISEILRFAQNDKRMLLDNLPDSICGNLGESDKISISKAGDEHDSCREDIS